MSTYQIKIIAQSPDGMRFCLKQDGILLTFQEVLHLWQTDKVFRDFYLNILIEPDFQAYYWEHPGLVTAFLSKPYECVLMNSAYLDKRQVDPYSFIEFFNTNQLIVDFDNLGKNARLIVPTPKDEDHHYKHLARFMRSPQTEQKHELLKQIGKIVLEYMSDTKTLWLSTAGAGVIWLHVRLDSRPKYYKTRRYKNADFLA